MLKLFSWVVLSSLARQLAFLVVNIVLFGRLSRSTYGAIALGFGYLSVFAGLGEFGIRQIGWREVARSPEKVQELTTSFLSAKTCTAILSAALYVALMPLLWEADRPKAMFFLFGLAIVLNGGTFEFPLYGLHRMDLVARYSALAYAMYLVGCVVLIWRDDSAWLVPALFLGAMGLLLVLELRWFRARYGAVRLRVRYEELRRILRESWPLGVGDTMNRLVLTYPVILIGFIVGTGGVGDYRVPELLYAFLAQFGHLFASAGFSQLSHAFRHRGAEVPAALRGMLAWTAAAALLAGAGMAGLGPLVFALTFPDRAGQETLQVLRVLGAALVFAAPVRFLNALLASVDRQQLVLVVNGLAVLSGVGVGWIACTRYGIVGMSFAVLVTEALTAGILLGVYWKVLWRRGVAAS